MRIHGLVALVLLGPAVPAAAQKPRHIPRDTLAWIAPRVITSEDLLQRLELMPFPENRKGVDPESLKAMTLRAMIAERVLADERTRLGLPDDRGTALMQGELENALVRDELYRRQVLDRSSPGKWEIAEGLRRFPKINRVISFLVRSDVDGNRLYGMLNAARPGSLLKHIPPSLYTEIDTLIIKLGAPDTAFENAAYAIGSSRVSRPFHSASLGWAVLYLLDRSANPVARKMELADRTSLVKKTLGARHESERYEQYYREVLGSRNALADSAVFSILADSVAALWAEDTSHFLNHGSYILTGDLVELIASRLAGRLDTVFVRIDGGDLTLGQVLEMFRYADFRSKERSGLQFRKNLNGEVRDLVAQALLAREGRSEGLQYAPEVRKELEIWTDYWRARTMYYSVRDSVKVSEEDILRHLVKNGGILGRWYEVNLREVLCDSLSTAEAVLGDLGRGVSFSAAASRYTRRADWVSRGGASGWFSVDAHPALGFEAMNADTGKIAGPVKLDGGWSIFQVAGKRPTPECKTEFGRLKENVRSRLLAEKRKIAVDRYIADLVRARGVVIDGARLKRITVTSVPMFTRRLIGFGGRMAAFPMLMKAWDWAKEQPSAGSVLP